MIFSNIKHDSFIEVWAGEGLPMISVLMPLYKQVHYIKSALYSILSQRGVVVEIIISDDASFDGTFDLAWESVQYWLTKNGSKHRVVMRSGSKRLWRDHLPLLVDNATCDIVCQAHGDDESHPDRARITVDLFKQFPRLSMLACEPTLVNELGELIGSERPLNPKIEVTRFSYKSIMEGHSCLIGFSQAWRVGVMRKFERLDRSFSAVAHDRILAFRASLVGDVMLINAQLIRRREHSLAASKLMFIEPGRFAWALACLTALNAMKTDLYQAKVMAVLTDALYLELISQIDSLIINNTYDLTRAYCLHAQTGTQITWVDEDTLLRLRSNQS
ncbi:MAG: glycosyltransferase [Pseudomonadota bacterium]